MIHSIYPHDRVNVSINTILNTTYDLRRIKNSTPYDVHTYGVRVYTHVRTTILEDICIWNYIKLNILIIVLWAECMRNGYNIRYYQNPHKYISHVNQNYIFSDIYYYICNYCFNIINVKSRFYIICNLFKLIRWVHMLW